MNLSELLNRANDGDDVAHAELVQVAYDDLREIARAQMRSERPDHTLTATALVHEVSSRMLAQSHLPTGSRGEFLAYVAAAMRNLLVSHARSKQTAKRGGREQRVQLAEAMTAAREHPAELIELDEALTRLAEIDPRRARVVELRYFAGMSVDEVAESVGSSPATVKRDWSAAKLWLADVLRDEG